MLILMKIAKFIDEGGPVEYLILGLLGLGLSVILERVWFFFIKCRINAKKLLADATALIRKDRIAEARKLCNQTGTPLGLILEAGIWKYEQAAAADEIKDALEEVALREVPRLQKRTHYLGLLANLCTLVGLLGTIFGLQEAFSALESADPSQKSKLLARGITLALNATALGLISAMVCMAAFTWLGSKANHLLEQIDETVLRLVNFFNAQRKMNPDRMPASVGPGGSEGASGHGGGYTPPAAPSGPAGGYAPPAGLPSQGGGYGPPGGSPPSGGGYTPPPGLPPSGGGYTPPAGLPPSGGNYRPPSGLPPRSR